MNHELNEIINLFLAEASKTQPRGRASLTLFKEDWQELVSQGAVLMLLSEIIRSFYMFTKLKKNIVANLAKQKYSSMVDHIV